MKFKRFIYTTFLFVFFFGTNIIFAKKVMTLPGVAEPFAMIVKNGKVYVSDYKIVKVFIYSIKEMRLLKSILKEGVGPQECIYQATLQLSQNDLCLFSNPGKILYYSKDGDYKKEFRIVINGLDTFLPVDKNYVASRMSYSIANSTRSHEFSIYTYENNKPLYKKLFYYYSDPPEKHEGNKQIKNLINDYTDFLVYDNKIFLGDSRLGLYVLIFDSNGSQIGKVKIPDEKIKITEQYKKDFLEMGKKIDPYGFEMVQKMSVFRFPEYFPGFFRFAMDRGKIYFLTYKFKGNQREVIVSDFKGNVLKKAYIPLTQCGADKVFAIENDKYYYIVENEDTEEYELHVADIK